MYKFENLNQTLIGMCREILNDGVWDTVRGFRCCAIPHPVTIEISNPTDRYVTIPQRKWNKYLPFAESLWIALGINDLGELPAKYCKNLYTYSDNGKTWRAGYGPRIRAYTGMATDPYISDPRCRHIHSGFMTAVDQLDYVLKAFYRDRQTRQAIIEIGDPVKDDFDYGRLKETKDYPCTRSIQFIMVNGALNCTVYIRSNDVLYGLSAVNVFNFTMMQEYIANILMVPIGKYYHIANNLHMYEDHVELVKELASLNIDDYKTDAPFVYTDKLNSLENFDRLCEQLFNYEKAISCGESNELLTFGNDMFDDWSRVFANRWFPEQVKQFKNPYLNKLFNKA